jgi:hypothetical protein
MNDLNIVILIIILITLAIVVALVLLLIVTVDVVQNEGCSTLPRHVGEKARASAIPRVV